MEWRRWAGQGVEKVIVFVVCLFVQHLNVTDDERQKLQVSVTASLFNSAVCEFIHCKCTVCVPVTSKCIVC